MKFHLIIDGPGNQQPQDDDDDALIIIYNVLRGFPDAHAAVVQALTENSRDPR